VIDDGLASFFLVGMSLGIAVAIFWYLVI